MKIAFCLLVFFMLHSISFGLVIDASNHRAKNSLLYPPRHAPQALDACTLNPSIELSKVSDEPKVSVEPTPPAPASFPPSTASAYESDTSQDSDQHASEPWAPTAETVFSTVFRAVITALSLFNVTMTWRIRSKQHTSCSLGKQGADDDTRYTRETSMAPGRITSASGRPYVACGSLRL